MFLVLLFIYSLVKAMMRMMAMSMKRNWKSPKLLRIYRIRKVTQQQRNGSTMIDL